jgi:pullulanase/glycogen debranching enzyme
LPRSGDDDRAEELRAERRQHSHSPAGLAISDNAGLALRVGVPLDDDLEEALLAGSADLYGDGRLPGSSINYVTCHDGFTLWDLVSCDGKHNEANGDEMRWGGRSTSS